MTQKLMLWNGDMSKNFLKELSEAIDSELEKREKLFQPGYKINKDAIEEGVSRLYRRISLPKPQILFTDNPFHSQKEANKLKNRGADNQFVHYRLDELAASTYWLQCRKAVLKKVYHTVWTKTRLQIKREIKTIPRNGYQQIFDTLHERLDKAKIRRFTPFSIVSLIGGGLDEAFLLNNVFVTLKMLAKTNEFVRTISFLFQGAALNLFKKKLAIICPTPEIHTAENRIHNETGPAIKWKDFSLYFLNDVHIKDKKIVLTPATDLSVDLILKEKNVSVRKEIVKKIGVQRMISTLGGKIIDRWEEYSLLELDIPSIKTKCRYLTMRNPSTHELHCEGVLPDISFVKDALRFRNQGYWPVDHLS